jgi:hypothetical protein
VSRTNPFTVIHLFRILQPCLDPIHIAAAFGDPIVSTSDFSFTMRLLFRHAPRRQGRSYNWRNHWTIQGHPEASSLYQRPNSELDTEVGLWTNLLVELDDKGESSLGIRLLSDFITNDQFTTHLTFLESLGHSLSRAV